MKQVTAAIVGYGNRGEVYGEFAIRFPERMKVVAVVDPNRVCLEKARARFSLSERQCFESFDEFLRCGKQADCVINTTMDSLHVATTLPLLEAGYDVLLEKPITACREELLALRDCARRNRRILMICHVLRYAPFYQKAKELTVAGALGRIIHIEASEHVCVPHMLTSYIRGKWRNRKECGSSFLLAKSCHDLDLLCWLNGDTCPESVYSTGARTIFVPERAPEGAGSRCLVDCPVERDCPYSCRKLYLENDCMPFLTWANMDVPFEDVTPEQKRQKLLTDIYGRCAYKLDGDLLDHQSVLIRFRDGSTAGMSLVSGASKAVRRLHIIGTEGELEGELESNQLTLRQYNPQTLLYDEEKFDVSEQVCSGHSGGDMRLIADFIGRMQGEKCSLSATDISQSIFGHLCVYAADRSVECGRALELDWD